MPAKDSPFWVPRDVVDDVVQDVALKAAAKRRLKGITFNQELGSTQQEVDKRLQAMRDDVNLYGEYVFGHTAARVHRFWNERVDAVIARRVRQNKILILAPPNSAKSSWNS